METYVVKEIREYEESILMGLNKRQLLCSILAILSAVGMYFGLRRFVGTEIIGWLCILVAIPFALAGFVRFQGMTAEKFVIQFIRSQILMPKYLVCQPYNLYAEILSTDSKYKEVLKID